ncbi:hypothetical protein OsI_36749 [Oryza sativa Indica Group]|uniref:Uncharacterized protein n=1 Tax=Oryza sativa subsp. indica TaxID=39946 RepID=B8BLF7_ORYSI|nr:hypothetical protein OsI_36749 [Oryza sativa Indica Group]
MHIHDMLDKKIFSSFSWISVSTGIPSAETHRYTTNNDGRAQTLDIAVKLNTKATQQLPHRRRSVIVTELAAQATQQCRLHNRSDTKATKVEKQLRHPTMDINQATEEPLPSHG